MCVAFHPSSRCQIHHVIYLGYVNVELAEYYHYNHTITLCHYPNLQLYFHVMPCVMYFCDNIVFFCQMKEVSAAIMQTLE